MNTRLHRWSTTAVTLVFVVSIASAQSRTQSGPPKPECQPRIDYRTDSAETAAATGRQQENCPTDTSCDYPCPPGAVCPDPCAQSGTQDGPTTDGESTTHDDRPDSEDGGSGGGGAALAAILGAVVGIVAIDQLTGSDWLTSDYLDANGPRFPEKQKPGRFQVQSFAAAGWPFAADIETQPGTWTWIELRYKNSNERHRIDLTRPEGGRRTEVVRLPGSSASVDIARFSIRSALLRKGHKPLYRPLKVYGLGAGPNAVGALDLSSVGDNFWSAGGPGSSILTASGRHPFEVRRAAVFRLPVRMAGNPAAVSLAAMNFYQQPNSVGSYLSVTTFGPRFARSPANVSWAVSTRRHFPKSQVEVLRLPNDGEGDLTLVSQKDLDLIIRPSDGGTWSTLRMLKTVGTGTYMLQARAWRTSMGGGDWTGAYAPEYVEIR